MMKYISRLEFACFFLFAAILDFYFTFCHLFPSTYLFTIPTQTKNPIKRQYDQTKNLKQNKSILRNIQEIKVNLHANLRL